MALKEKTYKCPLCGYVTTTVRKKIPQCNHNQDEEGEPVPLTPMIEVTDEEKK